MKERIPFDIFYRPEIESGEYTVETQDGRQVTILKWDLNYTEDDVPLPILGLIRTEIETEVLTTTDSEDVVTALPVVLEEPRSFTREGVDYLQSKFKDSAFVKELTDVILYAKDYRDHSKGAAEIASEKAEELINLAGKELQARDKNNLYIVVNPEDHEG